MKKLLNKALILVLAMSLIIPSVNLTEAKAAGDILGTINASQLYMRTGPDTSYDNVYTGMDKVILENGQEVTLLGKSEDWYRIRALFSGQVVTGYSLGTYITLQGKEPAAECYVSGTVTANSLNVRTGPSTDCAIVQYSGKDLVITKDRNVVIIGQENTADVNWYHVLINYQGEILEGYCSGQYIAAAEEIPDYAKSDTKSDDKTDTDNKDKEKKEEEDSGEESAAPTPTPVPITVPDGYKLKTTTYSASVNIPGTVNTAKLNMRKSRDISSAVKTILKKGQDLMVIGSYVKTTKENDKSVKTLWYRVVVIGDDGKPMSGYVMGNYITTDTDSGYSVKTKYKSQVLYSSRKTSSDTVMKSNKKELKLPKGTKMTVLSDTVKNDIKWYKVSVTYKEKTYEGYIPWDRVSYVSNAVTYKVSWLTEAPAPTEVSETPVDDSPDYSFTEANALIKDIALLPIHTEAKAASTCLTLDDGSLIYLTDGQSVEVYDCISENDIIWFSVRFYYNGTKYEGYINSLYVQTDDSLHLMSSTQSSSGAVLSFEQKLEAQGFPESYKNALKELHQKYPLWDFRALQTGLNWDDVIAKESEVGMNLLPNSKSIEWKSLAEKAYSYKTDTFTVFDGSTWVTASVDAIKYYMDPRNFLDEKSIFQFEVLSYNPSYQNKNGVAGMLSNTAMSNTSYSFTDEAGEKRTISYEDTFMIAAEYSGVSPYHLASRVKQEVVTGTTTLSNSVSGTVSGYEGLYNFYNIGANDSTAPGGAIRNGLKYAQNGSSSASFNLRCLIPWTSPFRSILGGAVFLGNNYISRGQDTIYLQKFNVTSDRTYSHQYMTNVEAPYSEGRRVSTAYEDPASLAIVFSIPVYENMPDEACARPEKAYNPNNWLKTLKLYDVNNEKLSLTPSFDYTKDQEYTLIIGSDTDYIKISGTTVSSLAKITSSADFYPVAGENRLVITVEAENGNIREYIINVFREAATEQSDTAEPVQPEEGGSSESGETGSEGETDPGTEQTPDPVEDPDDTPAVG